VAATVVVALAYSGGALVFVGLVQKSLLSAIDGAATTRAAEVADEVMRRGVDAVADDLVANTRSTQVVQVLDATGKVVSTSSDAHTTAFTEEPASPGVLVRPNTSRVQLFDLAAPYSFVVMGTQHDGARYRVVVATSVEAQRDSVRSVVLYLTLGFPLVLVLVAVATWALVGRALAPVDQMRSKVDGIGATRLDERVSIPASEDEIARLAVTMNKLLSRLEISQAEQRQFIADASHELRSPLATVLAALELAEDDDASWADLQPLVREEAVRMQSLVSDLLLLAHTDEEGPRFAVDDVDLDDILAAEAVRVRSSGRLTVAVHLSPVRIQGDLVGLSQAVRNLVDNAMRAAAGALALTVETSSSGDAVVWVDDDGPGIEPCERQRVFGRFVRLDTSRDRTGGGSGLGLAIVERIVHAHVGTVTVLDAPIGGARFEIRLPQTRQPRWRGVQPVKADKHPQPPDGSIR
jgi:signal transduction histidine kinase